MTETATIWLGIIVSLFTIIGSIFSAVYFVKSSIDKKIEDAITAHADATKKNLETHSVSLVTESDKTRAELEAHKAEQKLRDQLCEQERTAIGDEVQTIANKSVLLDKELKSPDGIYPRLMAAEIRIDNVKEEILTLKKLYDKG